MSRFPPRRLSHSEQDALVLLVQGGTCCPDALWYEVAPLALLATKRYRVLGEEDTLQVAGLAVAKAIGSFDPTKGCFLTLCLTIIRNDLQLAIRAKSRQDGHLANGAGSLSLERVLEDDLDDQAALPRVGPVLPLESPAWVLERAIPQLSSGRLKRVLKLRSKGLRQQEIGTIIGVSQNRVSQLLQEAMAAVRPIINELIGEVE